MPLLWKGSLFLDQVPIGIFLTLWVPIGFLYYHRIPIFIVLAKFMWRMSIQSVCTQQWVNLIWLCWVNSCTMIVCCEVISLVLCNIVGKFRYLPLLMRLPAELGSLFGPSFIKGWVLRLEVPVSVRNSGMRQLLLQRKVSRMPQGFAWHCNKTGWTGQGVVDFISLCLCGDH